MPPALASRKPGDPNWPEMSPPSKILPIVSKAASLNPKIYNVAKPMMFANPNLNHPTVKGIRDSKECMAVARAKRTASLESFPVLSIIC